MRMMVRVFVFLCALWPLAATASMPEHITPRGGFIPLHKVPAQGDNAGLKLPNREARFLPLPTRNIVRAFPISVQPLDVREAAMERVLPLHSAKPKALTEDDAKLLLSIFSAGD